MFTKNLARYLKEFTFNFIHYQLYNHKILSKFEKHFKFNTLYVNVAYAAN